MKSLYWRLVNTLDRVFSEYIRLKEADDNGYVRCVTCGKIMLWKEADNGHYIGRKHMATRFDEMNCHSQCTYCNGYMEGQHFIYRKELVKRYGEWAVGNMETLAMLGGGDDCNSLALKIAEYRWKVRALRKEKGL